MQSLDFRLAELPALNQVTEPDLWQQQAVAALGESRIVVIQAPTGEDKAVGDPFATKRKEHHRYEFS